MANTYAISLEGSEEILHKQVVLQEYCTTEKKMHELSITKTLNK